MPVARDMLDTGATLLSVDQITDIKELREAVGEEVIVGGNLDPFEVIEKKVLRRLLMQPGDADEMGEIISFLCRGAP